MGVIISKQMEIPNPVHVYGAEWAGTSSTIWTRTDAATSFSNPVPYVAGATSYSSPFDDIMPWKGMTRITDPEAGELVAIPKFWFKWSGGGGSPLKLQIADGPLNGFMVSPAHMDRGDGKGERDIIYVGRYHCSSSYKSVSSVQPLRNIERAGTRNYISSLGSTIWQWDYAAKTTIQMLYLVEFADWDSQSKIGYGCGNGSISYLGYTDSMPYHTGTTQNGRNVYGFGTQYRYIEGLWDNVNDWLDGCYYTSSGLNIIINPANFSDNSNGILVGTPSNGYPSVMSVSNIDNYKWVLFPTSYGGGETSYIPDYWNFASSYPCLYTGGSYAQRLMYGMFYIRYSSSISSSQSNGARLMKLP